MPVGRVVDDSMEEGRVGLRVGLRNRLSHTDSQDGGKNQDDFLHLEVCSSSGATRTAIDFFRAGQLLLYQL